jgi:hypothetical protein
MRLRPLTSRRALTTLKALPRICATAAVAGLLAVTLACAKGAPRERPLPIGKIESGAGTLSEARKFLEGRWALESFELHAPGKGPTVLKGSGVLNYDDFGNLRMEIRADQASSDLLRAAGVNIRDGVISTDGRTAIDLQNHTLTYFLDGQPTGGGPLATNRPRHWEVTADSLTLTTRDDQGAPLSISRWKRSQ